MTKEEISTCIKDEIASILEINPNSIDERDDFLKLGLSSVQSLKIVNRIKKKLDMEINPVAMFEFKSVSRLSDYLCVSEKLNKLSD